MFAGGTRIQELIPFSNFVTISPTWNLVLSAFKLVRAWFRGSDSSCGIIVECKSSKQQVLDWLSLLEGFSHLFPQICCNFGSRGMSASTRRSGYEWHTCVLIKGGVPTIEEFRCIPTHWSRLDALLLQCLHTRAFSCKLHNLRWLLFNERQQA